MLVSRSLALMRVGGRAQPRLRWQCRQRQSLQMFPRAEQRVLAAECAGLGDNGRACRMLSARPRYRDACFDFCEQIETADTGCAQHRAGRFATRRDQATDMPEMQRHQRGERGGQMRAFGWIERIVPADAYQQVEMPFEMLANLRLPHAPVRVLAAHTQDRRWHDQFAYACPLAQHRALAFGNRRRSEERRVGKECRSRW